MIHQTDSLLADSLQLTNLIRQAEQDHLFLEGDLHQELAYYLEKYRQASRMTQFQIFVHYGLYWKVEGEYD